LPLFSGFSPNPQTDGYAGRKQTIALSPGMRDDCANKARNQPLLAMQRLNQFSFYPTLAETSGPALVFFSAASCGSCRHWKQLLESFASSDGIPVFEVDAGIDQALAQEFELFHLPALFLFVDGDYHCPLQCEASPPKLRTALAAARALPAEEAP
jgi:thiol-disulfide isomerase/thioredoxin